MIIRIWEQVLTGYKSIHWFIKKWYFHVADLLFETFLQLFLSSISHKLSSCAPTDLLSEALLQSDPKCVSY